MPGTPGDDDGACVSKTIDVNSCARSASSLTRETPALVRPLFGGCGDGDWGGVLVRTGSGDVAHAGSGAHVGTLDVQLHDIQATL